METNNLQGGMFPNMGSGMLGLEMSLHHPHHQHPPPQNPQNPQQLQQNHPMVAYGHHEQDHHHHQQQQPPSQTHQSAKQSYPLYPPSKGKPQLTLSDEDEVGHTAEDSAGDGKAKMSPWQRMKWTDSMIRLLIMVVFYIGDETGSEGNDPPGKKKGGSGGVLQKKGKWKSVSRAMLERGFYVSPQQCEDKFNDLNKRYKRVNDILGKGTACRVVENQNLLEKMDHLSSKMKEEVKKLLNSKHLFFREMCAYHNSCGGGGGPSGSNHSLVAAADQPSQNQHKQCFHSSENTQIAPSVGVGVEETEGGSKMVKEGSSEEGEADDEEEDDDDYDEDDDKNNGHDQDEERSSRKRLRNGLLLSSSSSSPLIQELSSELMSVVQDGTKSSLEKSQWIKTRLMRLEEQRVGYLCEAFELEKQRLKWVKFSSKKERDMEREKLKNERTKLENDRMVLLFRQKELELIESSSTTPPPPPTTTTKF